MELFAPDSLSDIAVDSSSSLTHDSLSTLAKP